MNTGQIGREWERGDARSWPPLTGRMLDREAMRPGGRPRGAGGPGRLAEVRFDVRFSLSGATCIRQSSIAQW